MDALSSWFSQCAVADYCLSMESGGGTVRALETEIGPRNQVRQIARGARSRANLCARGLENGHRHGLPDGVSRPSSS